jgi:anti-anti-sigma factor
MELKTKEIKGITIIELDGNVIGGPDVSALNDYLHKLITEDKKNVIVDLKTVSFINSSGLGILRRRFETRTCIKESRTSPGGDKIAEGIRSS